MEKIGTDWKETAQAALRVLCLLERIGMVWNRLEWVGINRGGANVQLSIAALVLLPYVVFTVDFGSLTLDTQTIGLTLIVGIVHTGVAYWLYFSALPKLEAARIAIFSYIDPAIAILLSVFVLMEPMTAHGMIGAVLILGAAIASEFVGKKS